MSFFAAFDAVVGVAHSAIEGLSTLLTPTFGSLAAAVAIVGFTVLVRLLVSPLSWLQARATRRGAALAPEIAKLREKHRNDALTLATETLALQRANGAGMGMTLLPALVQAPFFMIMYRLVMPGSGTPSGLLSGDLFGIPLTAHLTSGLPVFVVLLALATALAVWTSRRSRRAMAASRAAAPPSAPARKSSQPAARTAAPVPDTAALMGKVTTAMPYLTILMVAYLPVAGALYLVTTTAWTALETAVWRRPAPAVNR